MSVIMCGALNHIRNIAVKNAVSYHHSFIIGIGVFRLVGLAIAVPAKLTAVANREVLSP
jgi:hypothetical protein